MFIRAGKYLSDEVVNLSWFDIEVSIRAVNRSNNRPKKLGNKHIPCNSVLFIFNLENNERRKAFSLLKLCFLETILIHYLIFLSSLNS